MRVYLKFLFVIFVLAFLINTTLLNYSLYTQIKSTDLEVSNNLLSLNKDNNYFKEKQPVVVKYEKTSEDKKSTRKIALISSSQEDGKKEKNNDHRQRSYKSKKLNEATTQYLENSGNEANNYIVKSGNSVETITATSSEISEILDNSKIENIELDQKISLLSDIVSENIIKIKVDQLWAYTKGEGIKIVILDSGISPHDDLRIAGGISFVDADYDDYLGHGTQIAGIISALLNEQGIAGIAPEASIYAVKITNGKDGNLSSAMKGLRWSIDNNTSIIIMSFGFNAYSQIFKDLVNEAYENGIIIISASGNDGVNGILYPAKYGEVIAVGSVDKDNTRSSFSNYGSELELVAPGTDINTTALNNDYTIVEGTSYSAAYVAGVTGLLKSYNQNWSNSEIRSLLNGNALDLGTEGRDNYYGYGLVQASFEEEVVEDIADEYSFRIYNVTFEDDSLIPIFWKDFTGTIENISFSEGYYIIEREFAGQVINETLNVSEESSFKLLDNNCYTIGNGYNQNRLKVAQVRKEDPNTNDLYCKTYRSDGVCYIEDDVTDSKIDNRVYILFKFPFSFDNIDINSAELFFRFVGGPSYKDDGFVVISSSEPFNPSTLTWNNKPGRNNGIGTTSKISSSSISTISFTDINSIQTGFSADSAYYYLRGTESEGGSDGEVEVRITDEDTYLKICYSVPECTFGVCCDIATETFKPNSTPCGPIENPVCGNQNSCGGHAVQDQCTGTSAVCPNNNVVVDYPQACYELTCGGCGICSIDGVCDESGGISCNIDSDCDDSNPYTRDTCINPATCGSYCENTNYCGNNRCDSNEDEISCPEDCKVDDLGEQNLLYDSVGNLIADINYKYEYDEFNQLIKIKNKDNAVLSEYFYDDQGNRIKKIDYKPDGSQTTTYYPDPNFIRVVDSSGTRDTVFYYDGSSLVGRKDNTGTYYYHPDHLGSTNVVTDLSGNVVERTEYLPFGAVLEGGESRFLFTGKEKDSTGLMYYGARYYDPFTRHFTQPDTVLPDVYDPLQLNRYAYARNNPVKYTDPSGNTPWAAIGGVIGFGLDVIKQILSDGRSIFSGTIDWGEASSWGVGGAVATTTFGIGPAVAGSGIGGWALGGGIGGFAGGRSTQLSYNLLHGGVPWNQDLLNAGDIGIETAAGVGLGVIGKGVGSLIGSSKTIGYRNIAGKTRKIENIKISQLRPSQDLISRTDPDKVRFLMKSMDRKGFNLDKSIPYTKVGNIDYAIPQGHKRLIARSSLGYKTVPAFRISNADVGSFRGYPNAFFKGLPEYKGQRIDDYAKRFK